MSDQDRSHHQTEASPHKAHVDEPDHGGVKIYWYVFGALVVLTMASFFTYSPYWPFKETPSVGWAFMMAVSCTKASLVMMFFMHLLWEANWKYVLTIPAATISLFLLLMLVPDVGYRTRHYSQQRLLHAADPVKRGEENVGSQHGDADELPDEAGHSPGSGQH